MYPANQLGVGYTEDDLPDTINYGGQVMGVTTYVVATRTGSEYVTDTQSNAVGQTFTNTIAVETNAFGDLEWIIDDGGGGVPCLILGYGGEFTVEDNFEDTYSYTLVFNGNTIESGTITRISLCIWSNTNLVNQIEGGAIFTGVAYGDATNSFGDLGVPFAWATYDGNDFKATKTPPQNSPEGTYIAVGGLYDGAVATVFQ